MSFPPDWIVPDWPAPPNVRAFVTTRNGGVSTGCYASLNLGLRTGDDPRAVASNRAFLRSFLPREPTWLKQLHGTRVVDADAPDAPPEADASIAREVGTVCAILIADCLPVLLCDRFGKLVAAAHAGWRGLSGGVIEHTVREIRRAGVSPQDLLAYLGPAIGPAAFEVGADVRNAFIARDPLAASGFTPHREGKWLADLFALARQALQRAGISHIFGGGLCTLADPQRFFSYRRDGITGRMAALIWRAS